MLSRRRGIPLDEQIKVTLEEMERHQRWINDFDMATLPEAKQVELKRFQQSFTAALNRAYERRVESLR